MSIQFNYSTHENPSVPVIGITVFGASGKFDDLDGKIDTGSSIIVIPSELIDKLDLKKTGKTSAGSSILRATPRDTYHVRIKVGPNEYGPLKAITGNRSYVLLGRNLLNLWKMELDGENTRGKIIPWSTNPSDSK